MPFVPPHLPPPRVDMRAIMPPPVCRCHLQAMMFDGASKTFCMTGWRLGWAVMPPPLAERIHLLLVHAIGCTANFTQAAGVAALEGPQTAVDDMMAEYQKRRDYVVQRLNAMPGVTCPTPAGAFYAFPDITGTGM